MTGAKRGVGWQACVIALLAAPFLIACYPWVGPVSMTIGTEGRAHDDLVVYSFLALAGLHEQDLSTNDPQVVPSEQVVRLGPWFRSPRYDAFWLHVYHPRFQEVTSMTSHLRGGPLELHLEMKSWESLFAQDPPPRIETFAHHLAMLDSRYVPTLPEAQRSELQRYLPELREFADKSRYVDDGKSPYRTEREARDRIEELFTNLVRATE